MRPHHRFYWSISNNRLDQPKIRGDCKAIERYMTSTLLPLILDRFAAVFGYRQDDRPFMLCRDDDMETWYLAVEIAEYEYWLFRSQLPED